MVTEGLALAVLVALIAPGNGLIGYDCFSDNVEHFSLDLTAVQPCPKAEVRYAPVVKKRAQVIQSEDEHKVVKGFRCHVVVTKEVTKCQTDSITYASEFPISGLSVQFSEHACAHAYKNKQLTFENKTINITVDRPYQTKILTKGQVYEGGSCDVETFKYGDREFSGYYEYSHLDIQVEAIAGEYNREARVILFQMDGNKPVRFPSDKELGYDIEWGTFMWRLPEYTCNDYYSLITTQEVDYYEDTLTSGPLGDIVMVTPEGDKTNRGGHAGLKLVGHEKVCNRACFATHIDELIVCWLNSDTDPGVPTSFKKSFNEVNVAKFTASAYRNFDFRLLHARRHTDLYKALCAQNKLVQQGRLNQIAGGNQHAVNAIFGPGYRATPMGQQAYIRKCEPVVFKITFVPFCTKEIPVTRIVNGTLGNKTEYLDPISRIVKPYSSNLTCSSGMPVVAKVDGFWHDLTPNSVRTVKPVKLKVQSYLTQINETEEIGTSIGDLGIYEDSQHQANQDYMAIHNSREAVLHDMAQTVQENTVAGQSGFGSPVKTNGIDGLNDIVLSHIFGWWAELMSYWAYFPSFLLLVVTIKIICQGVMRTYLILKARGPGLWLFSIFIGTLFNVAIQNPDLAPLVRKELEEIEREDGIKIDIDVDFDV